MSSRKSMQRQVMYNRQSKAWQQNQMKNAMAMAGYADGAPKSPSAKKLRTVIIIVVGLWILATVLLTWKLHWWGLLAGCLLGGAVTGVMIYYMRNKEKEILKYYKSMGIPKQEFFKQMRKNSKTEIKKKQMDKMSKSWDKIEVAPLGSNVKPKLNKSGKKKK